MEKAIIISQLNKGYQQKKGEQNKLRQLIKAAKLNINSYKKELIEYEQAREIVREVGLKTQQNLQFHISDIASLALNAVFDDPYELKVDFVQRRNKTECDLLFVRDGNEIEPMEASGYGAVDIASFALRVASWSLKNQKSRPVIILDEPMRFLSQDRQTFASNMIKELSEKLHIQFIIVTHEEVLTEYADKIFFVSQRRIGKWKKSKIIES